MTTHDDKGEDDATLDALAASIDAAEEVDGEGANPMDDAPPPDAGKDDLLNRELSEYERNDVGNARRLRRRFGPDLAYVVGIGWCAWDGRRFAAGDGLGEASAIKRAHWTVALMARTEVKALRDKGPPPAGPIEDEETDPTAKAILKSQRLKAFGDAVRALASFAVMSGNSGRLSGMLEQARSYLIRPPAAMDSNPWLLNAVSGTVRLDQRARAAEARAARKAAAKQAADGCHDELEEDVAAPAWESYLHDRADFITRLAGTGFDPSAACPRFLAFIERILPDVEIRRFVQRLFGYCLVGNTDEQIFVVFHGSGKNGKSKLTGIIRDVFGDYAATISPAVFLEKRFDDPDKPRPSLAKLPGKRVVFMSEPKKNAALDEGLVKEMTGGEPVATRKLMQDEFEYTPSFTPIMSANNKPDIRGLDPGIWRRIILVPFTVTIPPEERDPALLDKLRPELAGILNWCLAGLWEWQVEGLAPPPAVLEATEEYKSDSDPVGDFLNETCHERRNSRISAGELFEKYKKWCEDHHEEAIGLKRFKTTMIDKGYRQIKSSGKFWVDIDYLPGLGGIAGAGTIV